MAYFAQGKVEVFVGPKELGAIDDIEQIISDFIDGAEKTLDIAVQELDSEIIAQAILNATYRGVNVRMFTEQDYLKASKPPKPKLMSGITEQEARLSAQ